jgi:hypothetical protein
MAAGSELYSLGTDRREHTSTVASAHYCMSSRYQGTRSSLVNLSGLQRPRHNNNNNNNNNIKVADRTLSISSNSLDLYTRAAGIESGSIHPLS